MDAVPPIDNQLPLPVKPIEYAEAASADHIATGLIRAVGMLGIIISVATLCLTPLAAMNAASYARSSVVGRTDSYIGIAGLGLTLSAINAVVLVIGSILSLRRQQPRGRRMLLAYAYIHFVSAAISATGNLWWYYTFYRSNRMLTGGIIFNFVSMELLRVSHGIIFSIVLVVLLRRPEIRTAFATEA